jgi:hypothetical protein
VSYPITQRLVTPYPCRCGVTVRVVESEINGRLLIIDDDPHPDGDLIPWPAATLTGLARARRVTVPVTDGAMWREHRCP